MDLYTINVDNENLGGSRSSITNMNMHVVQLLGNLVFSCNKCGGYLCHAPPQLSLCVIRWGCVV